MTQIKCLTVPELRDVLKGHNLDSTGNKQQLLMRLSVWVRDEVASGTEEMGITKDDDESPLKPNQNERVPALQAKEMGDDDDDNSFTNCDDDDSSASSDEELELIGAKSEDVGVFLSNSRVQLSREESCKQMSQDQVERSQRRGPESRSADAILNRVTTDGDISYNDEGCGVYQEGESHCGLPTIKSTLRQLFGYSKFRDGQEWAISRCLNKQRSLLVAPTGFGKSLCFTLPAALMKGVCIVVSPLLSLIQDQIRLLPARLPAVTLSGPMSTASMAATLDDIIRGRIKLLFVSPERLTSASFRRLFRPRWNQDTNMYERYFPEVSLFCVDEAHCLSQWAHNFRPSYLRLRSIIDLIEPQSILAITATAGPRVVDDICRTLKIDNGSPVLQQFAEKLATHVRCGVRISKTDRNNIDVTCLFLDTHEQRLSKVSLECRFLRCDALRIGSKIKFC